MSIKHPKIYPVAGIVFAHLLLIFLGGYFLSPEFTVYPYLASLGLKPYLNVIDQHLPVLFFGPLSLPKSLTSNPQPLLGLFLSLLAITDILFFHLLKKEKVKKPLIWTALFILSSFVFSGNTLWLETFVAPIILLVLLLKPKGINQLFLGTISALIVLIRPTLVPVVLLLLILKKIKPGRFLIAGFLAPLLLTLTYLVYYQLLPSFLDLFLNFNATYYSALAGKLPTLRQLLLASLIVVPAIITPAKSKKILPIFIILLSLLPAWPRFELIHLLPAITLAIYFYATSSKSKQLLLPKLLLTFLMILSIKKVATINYGNFYLNKETQAVASYLKTREQNQLFILGGSDLIYPLTGKIPAGDYYLPSLPWYFSNKDFVSRQLKALEDNPQATIVINQNSSVGGVTLQTYAKPVFEYIMERYSIFHTVGPYQIYKIDKE